MGLLFLLVIASYFLGSIPVGMIVARFWSGVDIRNVGSGNIGATNVTRSVGKLPGIITLAGDVLKGAIPVLAAKSLAGTDETGMIFVAATGLAAFLGHIYSIFLRFKGGKGVATALGVFLALAPPAVLPSVALFAVTVLVFRYISVGSMVGAVSFPFFLALYGRPLVFIVMSCIVSLLVVVRHKDNLRRLAAGRENRFSLGGKKS